MMAKGKSHRPSRIVVEGEIARIELRLGGGVAVVDARDAELVSGYSWRRHVTSNGGVYVSTKLMLEDGSRPTRYLHRLIMGDPPLSVDHIDGDGLNNRRSNLRACEQRLNMRNRRPVKGRAFKGVYLSTGGKSWYAKIGVNGARVRSGTYPTPELAAAEYDRLAKLHHDEFARTNAQTGAFSAM